MKKLIVAGVTVLVLVALLVSVSCARTPEPSVAPRPVPPPVITVPAPSAPGRVSSDKGFYEGGSGIVQVTTSDRKIVRTGQMSLVVADVLKTRDNVAELATRLAGYVVSSQIFGEGQETRANITIRVPDESFEKALSELRGLAVRVTSEHTDSQDVSEEYVDLQSRLKNAEATEAQYLALLGKATNVEETLKIYERLTQVRNEIEQIKGRMQYLERITSMSLITVSLTPATSGKPLARAGWSALEVLKTAVRGIISFGQGLLTVVIWLAIFSPLWGIILGIIYWKRRWLKAIFKG